jgi:hypothetical protein
MENNYDGYPMGGDPFNQYFKYLHNSQLKFSIAKLAAKSIMENDSAY